MDELLESYLSGIPSKRRDRILQLRTAFHQAVEGVQETMRYRMPTFEKDGNWVCIGNQKHHLSVYFCSEELIRTIRSKYPRLSTGKGCVRIRDNQEVPVSALRQAFIRALSGGRKK